jgi:hypothetical protein
MNLTFGQVMEMCLRLLKIVTVLSFIQTACLIPILFLLAWLAASIQRNRITVAKVKKP